MFATPAQRFDLPTPRPEKLPFRRTFTEAVPEPPHPDDPRPFIQQNTPGAWG